MGGSSQLDRLLPRALACNIAATFLKVVASAIADKYIGESARIIREMFGFAHDHEPCVISIDEIDAIGLSRFSEGTSADRVVQRTLMELLNYQIDGFEEQGAVKMVMATNRPVEEQGAVSGENIMSTHRPDILDPALLHTGRLDQKLKSRNPTRRSD